MKSALLAALLMLVVLTPAEAKKAPKPVECTNVEAEFGKLGQISEAKTGLVLDNAVKFVEAHGGKLDKKPDAVQIGLFPDHSMGVFFLTKGCLTSLAPIPPQAVEAVIKAIMGDPA